MSKFLVKSPAKINLFLHIVDKKSPEIHYIESLFVFIKLYDLLEITINENRRGIYFLKHTKINKFHNTIQKAISLLIKYAPQKTDIHVNVTKNIPVSAGLAGGSSNAAAIIKFLGKMWNINDSILQEISLKIGSDVPSCLESKPVFVTGAGEQLTYIPNLSIPKYIILASPKNNPISTTQVFHSYSPDKFSEQIGNKLPNDSQDWLKLIYNSQNDLLSTAVKFVPDIEEMLNAIKKLKGCLFSRMSGSGSTCFGIFENLEQAHIESISLKEKYPDWLIHQTEIIL